MNALLIIVWIWMAMIALSFVEAYVEGRNPWDRRKLGWILRFGKRSLPAYHFCLFFVMLPLLIALPLVVYGWNLRLFGILLSAYLSGIAIEDFMWFVVNPVVELSEWNPQFADFYPWLQVGRYNIPISHITGFALAAVSWWFLWR